MDYYNLDELEAEFGDITFSEEEISEMDNFGIELAE